VFPPIAPTSTFPYRILSKVGEGGMGAVYRADDLELGRSVAIKVLKSDQLSDRRADDAQSAARRFLQEARAAAALAHPGVTTVYRVGTEGGWPYIAMEWLEGQTLEQLIAARRFSVEQAARIGIQVLSVLEVAHAAGVVHRDIKPSNLMVVANGRIKVMDFGVARVRDSTLAHTKAGIVLGTPHYAAPEQLAGEAIDSRVDLYALGSVLYEVVVGHPPFEATSLYDQIHAVYTRPPQPPSTLVAGVPAAFDAVLLKALAKRPDDRFATAAEMRAALQPFKSRSTPPVVGAISGSEATLARVPAVVVDGDTAHALVSGVVGGWPGTALGRQRTERLFERLLERPLHAPAFCGALAIDRACLLICDGIIYAAFDPSTGRTGDDLIEALADEVDAMIFAAPEGSARLVPLLASLLIPGDARQAGLDTTFTDLRQLAQRLEAQGFDGALRLVHDRQLGFALFSRGQRVLDVFGAGWSTSPVARPWEEWIARTGALASVEPRRAAFPSMTFRQQLRGLELEVVRPTAIAHSSIRSDTVADARAIELRPRDASRAQLRRGDSTLDTLVVADPAYRASRWILTELATQFAQFGRTARWKALVEPLARIREVHLHEAVARPGGGDETFDAVGYLDEGHIHHVVDRIALATREAVTAFVAKAVAVKESASHESLGAAILFAPRFGDDALDAYLAALSGGERRSIFSRLDGLTHREGFVRLGARSGLHVLLVEDGDEGRPRPLVPE
jgi:serine/threonine-protein kinase